MAPKITVTERNQQYTDRLKQILDNAPDIFRPVSSNIKIKEPNWHLHWINSSIRDGHNVREAVSIGYIFVEADEVDGDLRDTGATLSPEGKIVIGPRGEEVLMKCPDWYWNERQARKQKENIRTTFDNRMVKDAVYNAVGSQHGSQAADFVRTTNFEVKDSRERVGLDD